MSQPSILKQYGFRTIQALHALLICLAPIPYVFCERYFRSGAAARESNDMGAIIVTLFADYVLALIAVSLLFIVRRMKNGSNEREGLLQLFIAICGLLATFLLYFVMYLALPIGIVVVGIYNIVIAEKAIRNHV